MSLARPWSSTSSGEFLSASTGPKAITQDCRRRDLMETVLYRAALEPLSLGFRRSRMRPATMALLVMLTSVTLLPFGQQAATASCAGPYLTNVEHLVLHRGTVVEVDGAAFADGCQDVGSCSSTLGCTTCDYGPEPTPMVDINLSLRQSGRTWPLGSADAGAAQDNELGQVTWAVEIPSGVKPGRATLVPEGGQPTKVRIR